MLQALLGDDVRICEPLRERLQGWVVFGRREGARARWWEAVPDALAAQALADLNATGLVRSAALALHTVGRASGLLNEREELGAGGDGRASGLLRERELSAGGEVPLGEAALGRAARRAARGRGRHTLGLAPLSQPAARDALGEHGPDERAGAGGAERPSFLRRLFRWATTRWATAQPQRPQPLGGHIAVHNASDLRAAPLLELRADTGSRARRR